MQIDKNVNTDTNTDTNTVTNTNTNTTRLNLKRKRGDGAGGSQTNINGLSYEKLTELTELNDCLTILEPNVNYVKIKFNQGGDEYYKTNQYKFYKFMRKHTNKNIKKAHGCKNPDECYIRENDKIIFIIEKKFQQTSGSVCEKIQTADFKLWQYSRTFPEYKIVYIYCLSDWFQFNCKAELEYLKFKNVPVFWGKSLSYKNDIINFIINYE